MKKPTLIGWARSPARSAAENTPPPCQPSRRRAENALRTHRPRLYLRLRPFHAPRLRGERLLARPHLVQRGAVVQAAVLHDVLRLYRIPQVRERIGLEHEQVGVLPGLDGADVLPEPDRLRAVNR